jgi:SagB-type dehydrogenase family enzyme
MKSLISIAVAILAASILCHAAGEHRPIELPEPVLRGMPLEEAITRRRSERVYSEESLKIEELSQILFAAQGITERRSGIELRAAPSAGATYPLEIYVFVNRVNSLAPGVYHYLPSQHAIEMVKSGDYAKSLSDACLGQSMPEQGACSVVMTAVPERTTDRYGERGLNYVYMEVGHVSQNIYLQCTSLGLAVVGIGAFYDEELDRLLGIDCEREMSVFLNSIGRKPLKKGEPE